MNKTLLIITIIISVTTGSFADVILDNIQGEVKVRRGLDENWSPALNGMVLKVIDTILILEGSAELKMNDSSTFHLGSNSILDIGDLRRITKREMFLYLMSAKIDKISPRDEKAKLHVGNVSVVHGEMKSSTVTNENQNSQPEIWKQEFNGAMALYNQSFYTNTVIKLNKIQNKTQASNDCGKINYYLALSFEQLNEPGQAIDAYQSALNECRACDKKDQQLIENIESALKRLKI